MLAAQLQYQLMISSSWESSNLNIGGPANSTSSTCPDRSRDSAKSELIGCDQHQDAPEILTGCEQHQDTSEVMEIRTESDDESVKNEILALIIM